MIFHSYVNVYQRVVFFPCQKRLKSNFPTSPLPSLHLPPVWVWTATPVAPEAEPPGAPHPPAVRTRRLRHATAPWRKHGALNFPKLKSWGEDVDVLGTKRRKLYTLILIWADFRDNVTRNRLKTIELFGAYVLLFCENRFDPLFQGRISCYLHFESKIKAILGCRNIGQKLRSILLVSA